MPEIEKLKSTYDRDRHLAYDPLRVLEARIAALAAASRLAATPGRIVSAAAVLNHAEQFEAWLLREIPRPPRG